MIEELQKVLSKHPELIKKQYQNDDDPLYGHCYVASEVYYHLKGCSEGYKPYCLKVENGTHWFLMNKNTNKIIDITKGNRLYDYDSAKHVPFMTKQPSKRAYVIIKELMGL